MAALKAGRKKGGEPLTASRGWFTGVMFKPDDWRNWNPLFARDINGRTEISDLRTDLKDMLIDVYDCVFVCLCFPVMY